MNIEFIICISMNIYNNDLARISYSGLGLRDKNNLIIDQHKEVWSKFDEKIDSVTYWNCCGFNDHCLDSCTGIRAGRLRSQLSPQCSWPMRLGRTKSVVVRQDHRARSRARSERPPGLRSLNVTAVSTRSVNDTATPVLARAQSTCRPGKTHASDPARPSGLHHWPDIARRPLPRPARHDRSGWISSAS